MSITYIYIYGTYSLLLLRQLKLELSSGGARLVARTIRNLMIACPSTSNWQLLGATILARTTTLDSAHCCVLIAVLRILARTTKKLVTASPRSRDTPITFQASYTSSLRPKASYTSSLRS